MLYRILLAAIVAAFAAGIVTSALQYVTTTPLILDAERYENAPAAGGRDHAAGDTAARLIFVHTSHDEAAGDGEAWAPEDGLERTLYTTLATIGTSFGFALILLSVMLLSGAEITARSGLYWGLAGFVATGLAPALGLSPELPGSAAAELGARQAWWIGTAIATAVGLWLALRISTWWAIAGGIALLAVPHLIGAPHPHALTSTVPAELSGQFAAASLVVHAVTWAVTGVVAGYVWHRASRQADADNAREAALV